MPIPSGIRSKETFTVASVASGAMADLLLELSGTTEAERKTVSLAVGMNDYRPEQMAELLGALQGGANPMARAADGRSIAQIVVERACMERSEYENSRWDTATDLALQMATASIGAMDKATLSETLAKACHAGKVQLAAAALDAGADPKARLTTSYGSKSALEHLGYAKIAFNVPGTQVATAKLAGALIAGGAWAEDFFRLAHISEKFNLLNRVVATHPNTAANSNLLSLALADMTGGRKNFDANVKIANALLDIASNRVYVHRTASMEGRVFDPLQNTIDGTYSSGGAALEQVRARMVEKAMKEVAELRAELAAQKTTGINEDGSSIGHLAAATRHPRLAEAMFEAIKSAGSTQAAAILAARASGEKQTAQNPWLSPGHTPFELACKFENWSAIPTLAAVTGQLHSMLGDSPLLNKAIAHVGDKRPDVVRGLLDLGVKFDAVDAKGRTAMDIARSMSGQGYDMSTTLAHLEGAEIKAHVGAIAETAPKPTRARSL